MVAAAIAYFVTGLLLILAFYGLYRTTRGDGEPADLFLTMVLFFCAYAVANLGGI